MNNELSVGSKVCHIKDDSLIGYIIHIDTNLEDITTCRVVWGVNSFDDALNTPKNDTDIQWTNKLRMAE